MRKSIDIVKPPAKTRLEEFNRWMNSMTVSLSTMPFSTRTVIEVTQIPSEYPLGTTDGESYHLNPSRDEAVNDWTERH